MTPEMEEMYAEQVKTAFKKKGNKHFLTILKGEFKGKTLSVKVSVAGKSKKLDKAADAITGILRFVVSSNSPALGFSGTWELVNQVIEYYGLDPVDFSGLADEMKKMFAAQAQQAQQMQQQPQGAPQPAYA